MTGPIAASVRSHGWAFVHDATLSRLGADGLAAARRVFELDGYEKQRHARPEANWHVGWRCSSRPDRPEEVWQLQADGQGEAWPVDFAAERSALEALAARCVVLTTAAVRELAVEGGPLGALADSVRTEQSVVRLLHYRGGMDEFAFSPHTDLGVSTMFVAETAPALELERDGAWHAAHGRAVLAAGELLAAVTGERIGAVRHRVRRAGERWAVAVFVHPDPTFVVAVDDGRPLTASAFFARAMADYTAAPDS